MKNKELKLTNASKILKSEFIGLDDIIDQIIDSVRPWYLLNNLITKPVIINLWGLTGVGKTHLVHRLAELIKMDDQLLDIDMATFNDWNIEYRLSKAIKNSEDKSKILVMDEFQLGRTINEDGSEKSDITGGRLLWQLLDTGKFQIDLESRHISQKLESLKYSLLNDSNMIISNNQIDRDLLYKHDIPGSKIRASTSSSNIPMGKITNSDMSYVFTKNDIFEVYNLLPEDNKWNSITDFASDVNAWNTSDFIHFLCDTEFKLGSASDIDLSRSIIFVIGNLDEAYTMHDEFNPDLSPDDFHDLSKKVTITDIKDCLKNRFRVEQIARLGNNHIIYPSFSSKNYNDIIKLLIEKDVLDIENELGIEVYIDKSIHDLIYSEGVYPTQGVRPVQSTEYELLRCNLIKSISECLMDSYERIEVRAFTDRCKIGTTYYSNGKVIFHKEYSYIPKLTKLRESKCDDFQAVTAVHESGHAIVSTVLYGKIPEQIVSVSSDSNASGFMNNRQSDRLVWSRLEVIFRAAVSLAGIIAENIIFGEDRQSRGSQSDLTNAIDIIGDSVTKQGLFSGIGEAKLQYSIFTESNKYIEEKQAYLNTNPKDNHEHNYVIKSLVNSASSLANSILAKNRKLLIKIASYLSTNSSMTSDKFKEFVLNDYDFNLSHKVFSDYIHHDTCIELKKDELDHPRKPYSYKTVLDNEFNKIIS